MPPAKKRARVESDYSWAGKAAPTVADIKPEHVLRAVGLYDLTPCPIYEPEREDRGDPLAEPLPGASKSSTPGRNDTPVERGRSASVASITEANGATRAEAEKETVKREKEKERNRGRDKVTRLQALAKAGCTMQACRANPICYNHVGIHIACSDIPKEKALAALEPPYNLRDPDLPVGLRNLGMLCYANAFLQVWFHNLSFRNGLYRCHLTETSNLAHLVTIFAFMQEYEGNVADPSALVEALGLKHGEQQDAGEFSKLFMDVIRRELESQPDPAARNLMSRQFEGKLRYETQCFGCGHRSSREECFLELELSLKDGDSLKDRINALTTPETLTGDNKYHCSSCDRKCDAKRSVIISEVPEVVHFSLLRFTYDLKSGTRKKSQARIHYPRSTMFDGVQYDLQAVVTHEGKTAYSGHFVCDVMDQQKWYHCSDEVIRHIPDRERASKLKDGHDVSRDAYMLVYVRQSSAPPPPAEPPARVMATVEASNVELRAAMQEHLDKCDKIAREEDELRSARERVAEALSGRDCIVPRESLVTFFKCTKEDLAKPFSYEDASCAHSTEAKPLIHPNFGSSTKLISQAAFDLIANIQPIVPAAICTTCVAEGFDRYMAAESRHEQAQLFDELNKDDRNVVMPKKWLDEWRSGKSKVNNVLPTSNGYSLFCGHGEPYIGDRKVEHISAEALSVLTSAVGDFSYFTTQDDQCAKCAGDDQANEDMRTMWDEEKRKERKLSSVIIETDTGAPDVDYYALSPIWYEEWKRFKLTAMPRPVYKADLCEHGGLPVDPAVESLPRVTKEGWSTFQQFYGQQTEAVIIRYGRNRLPGALTDVVSTKPDVCAECCRARGLEWAETTVHIMQNTTRLGSTRSRSNNCAIRVTKETTLKDLRVEIMKLTKISPLSQELTYEGKRLDKAEVTMHDLGITKNARIRCAEIIELDEEGADGPEGFHGTALVGHFGGASVVNTNSNGGADSSNGSDRMNGKVNGEGKNVSERKTRSASIDGASTEADALQDASADVHNDTTVQSAIDEPLTLEQEEEQLALALSMSAGGDENSGVGVACWQCTFLNDVLSVNCAMCETRLRLA